MKVLVLIADGKMDKNGERMVISGLSGDLNKKVPVTLNYSEKDIVGFADLSVEEDKVYAEVTLFDTEKANLKKRTLMYPCISGYVLERDEKDRSLISKYAISSVSFCVEENVDDRIPKA